MESFFTLEIIPHFHGAHKAGHTANWELLPLSMPLMHLPFGIILPREKNGIHIFDPSHASGKFEHSYFYFIMQCLCGFE